MSQSNFSAVIFDLDGVVTQTALVHSTAWKMMFDDFLKKWAKRNNQPFIEFDHERDYLPYIDGKPRYQGVQSFLEHRGIGIPYGLPVDPPDAETVCGLGNRKNKVFNEILQRDGVQVYSSTVKLIHQLKDRNIKIGLASSSKNSAAVLQAAGLLHLFETRVDGVVSEKMGLKGKPAPDIFLTACKHLQCTPSKAVVVEDAVSGVQAGRNGNFGLVLGIAREGNAKALKQSGADIVVGDLGEIELKDIEEWFCNGLEDDNWSLSYYDYDKTKERSREALLTIGNGYFGSRGAFEESVANPVNYPGTYVAGLYNRLVSRVAERDIENEDFVRIPDWLQITFRIDGGDWFDPNKAEIVDCYRNLDFRNGILHRVITVKDSDGKETLIQSWRLASMKDPHLAALKYTISPINYKGKITLRSTLNGNIINDGVDRYRQLNQKHLQSHNAGAENNICWLVTKTSQSGIQIAQAVRCDVFLENKRVLTTEERIIDKSEIHMLFSTQIETFQVFTVEKVAAIYTSKHDDSPNPLEDAKAKISETISFNQLVKDSKAEWKKIWSLIDINIQGDRLTQKLLRLHLYHLMVSFSPHNQHFDASITARGLHGEAYRGHIFWDELFILPLYAMHFPEAARSMLMYRYRRLGKAREYAIEHGYKGAMFPWQSGSDGREETQIIHLNPVSGKWGDDYSSLQRHVSLAIAYNIWNYLKITGDINFLRDYGAEMFFEICRFWASMVEKDCDGGRYSIKNVMGPDEFHEAYPNSTEGGLKDNSYTNLMVAWMMSKAPDLLELLKPDDQALIKSKLLLNDKELTKWEDISTKINIVVQNGIIAQYDGYFDLKELDWDFYKKKYGNVHRMDRLLKAEGKSADEYKVAKQADTIMTFYNLTEEEVTQILKRLGYCLTEDYLKRNLDYYLGRTSHGSTLSRVVHAYVSNKVGNKVDSWKLYKEALISDFTDIQGGTTGEGIHTGVMAGTVLVALRSFAGVDIKNGMLYISPNMPEHWEEIRFNIGLSSDRIFFNVTAKKIELKMEGVSEKILVKIKGENYNLFKEQKLIITF